MKKETVETRFWRKVAKTDDDKCWEWQAVKTHGYGFMWVHGKNVRAHRLSWMIANGEIPDSLHVLHKCDNPGCVNPSHLFIGNNSDNMKDMFQKGRASFVGESNNSARLKKEDVLKIRSDLKSISLLALEYGVHVEHIRKIKKRKTWTHI